MFAVLSHRTFRRLFAAQVVALTGTGLATVALGLLAYDLAGAAAGAVLGTALAIKMAAYVGLAPLAGALAARVPRRALLVTLDLLRAGIALVLPWVDQVWQVYLLIFLLHAASAVFTPVFRSVIPEILPAERDYTRGLTLSRLAYDLESLLSPLLAAALLLVVGHDLLFAGTAVGFAASALLVLPALAPAAYTPGRASRGTTRGVRIYLATPRLRGLLAAHLAVSAAGAMVLVNTVAYVRDGLGRDEAGVALALAANGLGSVVAALALPRLLDRFPDRAVMLRACAALAVLLGVAVPATLLPGDLRWPALLVLWALLGAAGSLVLTPAGRLLRRSAQRADLPAVFAADFALAHACWLLCYPLAGWLATTTGMPTTLGVLGAVAAAATVLAVRFWPAHDPEELPHDHHGAAGDHFADAVLVEGRWRHAHPYRVDDLHARWPA